MADEQLKIEKGDKVNIMSRGVIGTFVKVYDAQNIDGEKRKVCSVKVGKKEIVVDIYDIEFLEKAPKPPRPIFVSSTINRMNLEHRGWFNNGR